MKMTFGQSKKFNGAWFTFHDVSQYKGEARAIAKAKRKHGYNARVVKATPSKRSGWKKAWQVWIRKR
jgi:hypothetical protein